MTELSGRVLSVQVGSSRFLRVGERTLRSAIHKQPVEGPVQVVLLGLAGDEQNDLSVHGGLSKAVYALPRQHLAWWSAQRAAAGVSLFDAPLTAGMLGENLSLEGVDEQGVFIGDRLHFVGGVVLRVSEPRQPCAKFNAVLGYALAAKQMVQSGCCGFYMAVEVPGALSAGEAFALLPGPRQTSIAQRPCSTRPSSTCADLCAQVKSTATGCALLRRKRGKPPAYNAPTGGGHKRRAAQNNRRSR